jgi:release factor glutamine methyltransferase
LSSVDVVAVLRAAGCVYAEDEAALLTVEAAGPVELDDMVARRVRGEPLEYVVGWAEFCGLRIAVAPGVFVPRRRTTFMVDLAADVVRPASPGSGAPAASAVLDLCCGSGAVGAALASRRPGIELHCADIDPIAVDCARRNTAAFAGHCYVGDLWDPLPPELRGRVDVLVVNAPYVPTDEVELMPREARDYEARAALDGGLDGLDLHRRVAADAQSWLAAGGSLFIETSARQAPVTAGILAANGFAPRLEHRVDDDATVVLACRE